MLSRALSIWLLYIYSILSDLSLIHILDVYKRQVLIQTIFGGSKNIFMIILSGVFLTAILAAIMSTADSQLLVTASTFGEDLYRLFSKKKPSSDSLVRISRYAVVVIALIAIFISLNRNSSVFELVSMAWGGFGAAFGPCILFLSLIHI